MNMISTGAFLPEMDASNKQETLAEKFARVWEKKNSKAARAGGVSLMALSLAACGSDSEEAAADPVVEEPVVVTPEGVDEVYTTLEDTFAGVAGADDTFTATSATITAADDLVDTSATDNDTLNVTLTAAAPVMDVNGIENVNITWDSLLVPTVDADDIRGATITLTTARTGHNGNANVDNADGNNVSFGAGFDGTVTVDGLDGANVTATAADTVDVGSDATGTGGGAADGTIVVDAGVATTVVVTGGDDVTVTATSADDITINGGDAEVVTATVGADADLTLVTAAAGVATFTSTAAEAIELAIQGGFTSSATTLVGSINLDSAIADINGETITGAGTVTINNTLVAADLSDIAASGFVAEDADIAAGGVAISMASGSSITLETGAFGSDLMFQTTADDDAAADVLNVTLEASTDDEIDVANGTGDFETLNLTIDPAATVTAVTIDDIDAGTGTVNMTSARADVDITITAGGTDGIAARTFDASAVAGELTATQNATAAAMSVIGAADATTMTFTGTTHESTFESTNAADDSVTFANTSGSATAVFAGGDNTTLANSLDTGTLSVTAGAGDDVVEVDALTSGHVTAALGDGDNTIRIGSGNAVAATASVTVTTGTGDNTVHIEDTTLAAGAAFNVDLGTGTGTLLIDNDENISANTTITITGLDVIDMDDSTAAEVNAALLDGATLTVTGDGGATDMLGVTMTNTAAASVDFSGVTISTTVGSSLLGLDVTGTANADTIVGSSGADTLGAAAGADVLTGGAGADTYNLGAADGVADTVNIAFGGEGQDVINQFEVANDVIDFTGTSDVVDGSEAGTVTVGSFAYISVAADTAITAGLTVIDSNIMGDMTVGGADMHAVTTTEIETYLANTSGGVGDEDITLSNSDDVVYIVASDGTDSVLFKVDDQNGDLVIDAADITIIATIDAVADADLLASNFADFV